MASQQLKPMSLDEFLVWAEQQPKGRFELIHGQPVAMAAERVRHARTKQRVAAALAAAIRKCGLGCEALPDGMAVPIRGKATREPDALVTCGAKLADDAILVPAPVIVVEVKSPSTAGTDAWDKVADYLAVPSIAHYLIVDPVARTIFHHRRVGAAWEVGEFKETACFDLTPPGLMIDARDLLPED